MCLKKHVCKVGFEKKLNVGAYGKPTAPPSLQSCDSGDVLEFESPYCATLDAITRGRHKQIITTYVGR